ncbi:uncharacterized protein LOC107423031 [Ziziphus jujuba]|uniref:Uncharacterized protein LOC107423031 n=2 Tax=Ziziphus jujuba TaxID=326968 RepID=A0A6P4AHN9_ZIZJJ|nr:uncharacterized protein LOC107423031 [Ziziphus jujuba]KAH7522361.1 hypothetical protein FEM48_Zijuj07G0130200 [Ziziphus jujuba var. spinosa]
MEVAMEVEDDSFFADLSKQISLLIMDDEEDPLANCPSVSLQAFSHATHPPVQSPFLYEQVCRRESKGTGVFIPQSSQPRRKNRQGRFTSYNTKSQRQPENNKIASQLPSSASFKPKYGRG